MSRICKPKSSIGICNVCRFEGSTSDLFSVWEDSNNIKVFSKQQYQNSYSFIQLPNTNILQKIVGPVRTTTFSVFILKLYGKQTAMFLKPCTNMSNQTQSVYFCPRSYKHAHEIEIEIEQKNKQTKQKKQCWNTQLHVQTELYSVCSVCAAYGWLAASPLQPGLISDYIANPELTTHCAGSISGGQACLSNRQTHIFCYLTKRRFLGSQLWDSIWASSQN